MLQNWATSVLLPFLQSENCLCHWKFGFPRWHSGKESACQCKRHGLNPSVGKIPWRRKWQPNPILLFGKSHGQRSLAGYSSWGHKQLDTTEQLSRHTHTHTHTHIPWKVPNTTGRFRSMSNCYNQETFMISKLLILRIWQQKNRHLHVWLADRNWIISREWTAMGGLFEKCFRIQFYLLKNFIRYTIFLFMYVCIYLFILVVINVLEFKFISL